MGLTDDPRVPHAQGPPDETPVPQAETYLVLSEAERAKGFVRPVRRSYVHVGTPGPRYPLRDLTDQEREWWGHGGYVKFEPYPDEEPGNGRLWTQEQLDNVGQGCRQITTMGQALAETYARQPAFYGATYCCGCRMHRAVGKDGEFVWIEADGSHGPRVGT